jgi:hypothetical protein
MNMGKIDELSLMIEGYQSSGKADVTSLSIYPMVPAFPSSTIPPQRVKYGDVNGDGMVNAGDYTLVRRYILRSITEFTDSNGNIYANGKIAGDVNDDGKINAGDYTLIRRYILSQINIFPAEDIVVSQPLQTTNP